MYFWLEESYFTSSLYRYVKMKGFSYSCLVERTCWLQKMMLLTILWWVSILWPRHRTQNSSSSIFLFFFIFPFMHLRKKRFRWLQFEDNLLQLLVAASAAAPARMGISLTWMQEQITHQLTQSRPALWSSQKEKSSRGKGNRRQIPYPEGLPRWCSGKEHTDRAGDARDMGSIPGSGRSPGEGNGNPLQYSCLGHPMDRGAWWATVHGVLESDMTEHAHTHKYIQIDT